MRLNPIRLLAALLTLASASARAAESPQRVRDIPPDPNRPYKSVAFVMDASAAAAGRYPGLADNVQKAVSNLTPDQSFAVVLAVDGKPVALGPKLLPGTKESRAKLGAFLKGIKPAGKPDTAGAMRAALAYQADLVHLVVGIGTSDVPAACDLVLTADAAAVKAGRGLRIFCLYVEAPGVKRDDADPNIAALRKIADRCSSLFKLITEEPADPPKSDK